MYEFNNKKFWNTQQDELEIPDPPMPLDGIPEQPAPFIEADLPPQQMGDMSQDVNPTLPPAPVTADLPPTIEEEGNAGVEDLPPTIDEEQGLPQAVGTPIGTQAEEPFESLNSSSQQSPSSDLNSVVGLMQPKVSFERDSSTSTTSKSGMAPASREQVLKANETLAQFTNQVAELRGLIGEEKAQQVEEAYNEYAGKISSSYEDFERTFENIQGDLAKVDASLKALSEKKIDPNRYIKGMSTTDKLISALAAGLEAGWNSLVKDPALKQDYWKNQVQNAIKMDIAMQEKELEQEKGYLTDRSTMLRNKLQDFGTMNKAKLALEADMLKITNDKIEAWANGANAAIAPEEAQMLIAQNNVAIAEKTAQMISSNFTESWKRQEQEGISAKDALSLLKEGGKQGNSGQPVPSEYAVPLPNGKFAVMMSKDDATKTRESLALVDKVKSKLNEVLKLRSGMDAIDYAAGKIGWTNNKTVGLLKSLQSNIAGELAQVKGLGALTGPDLDLVIDETGILTSFGQSVDARIQSMIKRLDREVESKLKSAYGFVDKEQILSPGVDLPK